MGDAAEEQLAQAAPPVGTHHDEVGFKFPGVIHDGLCHVGDGHCVDVHFHRDVAGNQSPPHFRDVRLRLGGPGEMRLSVDLLRGVALNDVNQRDRRSQLLGEMDGGG